MLTKTITIAEAIAEHERALQELRDYVTQHPKEGLMQLTPTGSFSLGVGSVRIGSVVSLLSSPGAPWQANREHWFGEPSIDFGSAFGSHGDLSIIPECECGTVAPCSKLTAQMSVLAATWSASFQMYALGVLAPSNWDKTRPQLGSNLYAFEADESGPTRPRIVFDVNAEDPTKLDRIVWLSDDDSLSAYPLKPLVLKYAGTVLPEASYYYTASR